MTSAHRSSTTTAAAKRSFLPAGFVTFVRRRLEAWLQAYHAVRPFTEEERAASSLRTKAQIQADVAPLVSILCETFRPIPVQGYRRSRR